MEGEFNSMLEIHKLIPDFVPKPPAWGNFQVSTRATYFILATFLNSAMVCRSLFDSALALQNFIAPAFLRQGSLASMSRTAMGKFLKLQIGTAAGPLISPNSSLGSLRWRSSSTVLGLNIHLLSRKWSLKLSLNCLNLFNRMGGHSNPI